MAAVEEVCSPKYVGIVLFNNFEELDAVGPLEVFGVSEQLATKGVPTASDSEGRPSQHFPTKYHPITISVPGNEGGKQVRGGNGMTVIADYAADDPLTPLPALDIVLVPGGQETRELVNSHKVVDWLAGLCNSATWVTSVCTGVFMLHRAGHTKGKRVATHYLFEDKLESLEDVTVVRDQRWVVDGNLVTCQGVSAGIDMSLWLVGQLYSTEHARETQKLMQYDPAPPYQTEK